MAYRLTHAHHGVSRIEDETGALVATVAYDTVDAAWAISANVDRWMVSRELPACLRGRFTHSVKRFEDVFAFFDIPLPGTPDEVSDVGVCAEIAAQRRARLTHTAPAGAVA